LTLAAMIDRNPDPKAAAHPRPDIAEAETFIQWLRASSSEDVAVRELAAFVRAAEGIPRSGPPAELKDWIRAHASPIRLAQVDAAVRIWAIRRQAGDGLAEE